MVRWLKACMIMTLVIMNPPLFQTKGTALLRCFKVSLEKLPQVVQSFATFFQKTFPKADPSIAWARFYLKFATKNLDF